MENRRWRGEPKSRAGVKTVSTAPGSWYANPLNPNLETAIRNGTRRTGAARGCFGSTSAGGAGARGIVGGSRRNGKWRWWNTGRTPSCWPTRKGGNMNRRWIRNDTPCRTRMPGLVARECSRKVRDTCLDIGSDDSSSLETDSSDTKHTVTVKTEKLKAIVSQAWWKGREHVDVGQAPPDWMSHPFKEIFKD